MGLPDSLRRTPFPEKTENRATLSLSQIDSLRDDPRIKKEARESLWVGKLVRISRVWKRKERKKVHLSMGGVLYVSTCVCMYGSTSRSELGS